MQYRIKFNVSFILILAAAFCTDSIGIERKYMEHTCLGLERILYRETGTDTLRHISEVEFMFGACSIVFPSQTDVSRSKFV
jgi:hypothetical protein